MRAAAARRRCRGCLLLLLIIMILIAVALRHPRLTQSRLLRQTHHRQPARQAVSSGSAAAEEWRTSTMARPQSLTGWRQAAEPESSRPAERSTTDTHRHTVTVGLPPHLEQHFKLPHPQVLAVGLDAAHKVLQGAGKKARNSRPSGVKPSNAHPGSQPRRPPTPEIQAGLQRRIAAAKQRLPVCGRCCAGRASALLPPCHGPQPQPLGRCWLRPPACTRCARVMASVTQLSCAPAGAPGQDRCSAFLRLDNALSTRRQRHWGGRKLQG
jgi:hypothetical protein